MTQARPAVAETEFSALRLGRDEPGSRAGPHCRIRDDDASDGSRLTVP